MSEGHRVSDTVYMRVRSAHPEVQDVLVHIDPEDDGELQAVPPGPLPERAEILAQMRELLGPNAPEPRRVQLHYLGQRIEVEIVPGASALNTCAALAAEPSPLPQHSGVFRARTMMVHIDH